MRYFRSLLIEKVDIWTSNLKILTLAVHRHLTELMSLGQHRHKWDQALLYLGGQGWQIFAEDRVQIETGSLVMIPAGVPHTFSRLGNKAPLCLVINFRMRNVPGRKVSASILSRSEIAQVRQSLAQMK